MISKLHTNFLQQEDLFRNTATTTRKSKVCHREEPGYISEKMDGQQHHVKVIPHKITYIIKKGQKLNRSI